MDGLLPEQILGRRSRTDFTELFDRNREKITSDMRRRDWFLVDCDVLDSQGIDLLINQWHHHGGPLQIVSLYLADVFVANHVGCR